MATPQRGLGKGLSALISENYAQPIAATKANAKAAAASESVSAEGGLLSLPLNQLAPGKYQPRQHFNDTSLSELADSIKANGIMQPLIVRPKGKNQYEIIAGERRWRAAKLAGLAAVPVIVRSITDKQALEQALVENIQRQDLSPLEEAAGYQRLIEEFDYTQNELATSVGKSRSHVANLLRLLSLPDEVKKMLDEGKLTMGHARALLTAKDPLALAREIIEKGMNVREAEEGGRVSKGTAKKNKKRAGGARLNNANKDPDIIALEESLSESLGLTVSMNCRGQAGEIILAYDTLSQLDEILKRLGNGI